jgi:hypothetical protein
MLGPPILKVGMLVLSLAADPAGELMPPVRREAAHNPMDTDIGHAAPDLAKIERSIKREPTYEHEPSYCLLVFGPRADTRVWLVEDGETLYVDRNANGDLTEDGESFQLTKRRDLGAGGYRDWQYDLGDIIPADGPSRHTQFKVVGYQQGTEPANQVLSVHVDGKVLQYAGWTPLFTRRQDEAPIIHFGGPVVCRTLRGGAVRRGKDGNTLHICFVTPGLGERTWARVGYEAVPVDVHPVVEIEWPADDPSAPAVRTTVTLKERC